MRNKLPLFLVKLFYYEYWPFWLFFLPLVPYWLFLSIRSKSLTFFTAVNPVIPHSGVFGESKGDILDLINPDYLPQAIYLPEGVSLEDALVKIQSRNFVFPIIAKPDVGERGVSVEKIDDIEQLGEYLNGLNEKVILQEFVDLPIELGVLYFRKPLSGTSGISSIVIKEFLTVEGNGYSTIRDLVNQNERFRLQLPLLEKKLGEGMNQVLNTGERLNLQPIGNHCLGTKFLSGQHLINEKLIRVFDDIAEEIPGFYFGRFDLKVSNLQDLYSGLGIKILELNGVTSEPGHIYDPKFNLFKAYRDTAFGLKLISKISIENQRIGFQVTSFRDMLSLIVNHFSHQRSQVQNRKEAA